MKFETALRGACAAVAIAITPAVALAAQPEIQRPAVMRTMERVADWQLANPVVNARVGTPNPRGWEQGAFYVGLTKLAERSASPRFQKAIVDRGVANQWQLGRRLYHADDHAIGEAYLWAVERGADKAATDHLVQSFESILKAPSKAALNFTPPPGSVPCDQRWCWSDALFMAPPVWFRLSNMTGDGRYADFADAEFRATHGYLFDPVDHLYYRDSRFFDRRTNGHKVFWSRGNGWAYAGLARVLDTMPKDDRRRWFYESVFKQMSAKLKSIQKTDGYWSPSLLDPSQTTPAETSGTGFFTYGLAWGVKNGLLDRAEYEPSIRKGWAALNRAVHPGGKLGWVQQVSDQPDNVAYEDTQYYGAGAFLLAGSAVHDLNLR